MVDNKNLLWQEDFKVRSYEVDLYARATLQTVCRYFQESAVNHAFLLKVDQKSIEDYHVTWVLSRLHVRMNRYPMWQEEVRVETWPVLKQPLFAIRDYELNDKQGKVLGVGSSSWMLIDLDTRKPVDMPPFMDGMENKERGRALDTPFAKIAMPDQPEQHLSFNVRHSDLDINRHVNSVNYIEWALEAVPRPVLKKYQPRELEISFRAEGHYGDRVISAISPQSDLEFTHQLKREADEKELARLITRWHKMG